MSLSEFFDEKARLGLVIIGRRIDLEKVERELRSRRDVKVAFSIITTKPLFVFEARMVNSCGGERLG